jgi:hypothetical protein
MRFYSNTFYVPELWKKTIINGESLSLKTRMRTRGDRYKNKESIGVI